jgi:hypothetical protein
MKAIEILRATKSELGAETKLIRTLYPANVKTLK